MFDDGALMYEEVIEGGDTSEKLQRDLVVLNTWCND
jgi:hypothetical protein